MFERRSGVRVTLPAYLDIKKPDERREHSERRSSVAGDSSWESGPEDRMNATILLALQRQAFTLVDSIEILPLGQLPITRPAAQRDEVKFEVPLQPGDHAVVLIEQDAIYSWIFASEASGAKSDQARHNIPQLDGLCFATFRLEIVPAEEVPSSWGQPGFIGELVMGRAKAFVLKFKARVAVEQEVLFLERNIRHGFVDMNSTDLASWIPVGDPADLRVSAARPARLLLFIHGIFSSTLGTFGCLRATPWGNQLLAAARESYDLVLGFDHPTLCVDPLINAEFLLQLLQQLKRPMSLTIDIVAHSRGALVARSLIEHLLPVGDGQSQIGRAILVAATNAGTRMARPENSEKLVDLYTNLAAGSIRALSLFSKAEEPALILGEIIQSLGAYVKYCADSAAESLPGLAAIDPGGRFIAWINQIQPPGATPNYFSITSHFEPLLQGDHQPKELPLRFLQRVIRGLAEQQMAGANDLVVDTASMTAIEGMRNGTINERFDLGINSEVHHINYFVRPEIAATIRRWLKLDEALKRVGRVRGERILGSDRSSARPNESFDPRLYDRALDRTLAFSREGAVVSQDRLELPDAAALAALSADAKVVNEQAAKPPQAAVHAAICHFTAQMDDVTLVHRVTTVEVSVSREIVGRIPGPTSRGASSLVDLSRQLTIQVLPKAHFELVGEDAGRVDVEPPAPGEPLHLYFDVRPTHIGEGAIWVLVRQGQVPLVTFELQVQIVERRKSDQVGRIIQSATPEAVSLKRPLHQLFITEQVNGVDVYYYFQLESPVLGLREWGRSPVLTHDRSKYVNNIYKEIEQRWLTSKTDTENFAAELKAYGASLFHQLMPESVQSKLWQHRSAIDSIQVISTEPFMPWELIYLTEPGQPISDDGMFLGELGLVRWPHDSKANAQPPEVVRIRAGRARYVIPDYPHADYVLPEAAKEAAFLRAHFEAIPVTAHQEPLRELLKGNGAFDLLHFAGHGAAEHGDIENSQLLLEGRMESAQYIREYFSAALVEGYGKLVDSAKNSPMVVLNACQAGKAGYRLTGVGGFARAFIRRGAGVFVGALWSVGDSPARTFTEQFYRELRAGQQLSQAAISARLAAKVAGDATWLAYVVYGHPHLIVSFQ